MCKQARYDRFVIVTRRAQPICPRCYAERKPPGLKYCLACHAAQMREWRKTHPLTPEQRIKMVARSYAHVYLKRGKLERKPCERCGSPDSQMHHPDYSQPLWVEWLCRNHHLEVHALFDY
jgi:hypothetical protein